MHFFKPQRALKWKLCFIRRNFAEAWKGLLDSCQAYFTKWTTSGSPPVGLQGHQDSKSSHSWVILYVTNWSSPCMSGSSTGNLDSKISRSLSWIHSVWDAQLNSAACVHLYILLLKFIHPMFLQLYPFAKLKTQTFSICIE